MMKWISGIFFGLFMLTICWADGVQTTAVEHNICPQQRPQLCTMDYQPVCAQTQDKTNKTYANGCNACAEQQVVSYSLGACPAYTLSANEVRQLFSDHSYEAHIPSRKITMTVYVDPDGTMRGMQAGHKFTSNWLVNEQGEICVSYRDKNNCRFIMHEDGQYKKYKIDAQGNKNVLVIYRNFSPGNVYHY